MTGRPTLTWSSVAHTNRHSISAIHETNSRKSVRGYAIKNHYIIRMGRTYVCTHTHTHAHKYDVDYKTKNVPINVHNDANMGKFNQMSIA